MLSPRIGIISGIGAAAGARMLVSLIAECQRRGAKRDSDFPEIMLHSMQSEGLDNTGIADEGAFRMELLSSVLTLNRCGVDLIMIACNTAHLYHKELQEISRAEILNMVDIAAEGLEGKSVAVFSSRTTRDTGLYATALIRQGVQRVIEANDDTQKKIDMIIAHVMAGINTSKDRELLSEIVNEYGKNADTVILGCTELPVVLTEGCIDPMEKIIARALSK